MSKGNSNLFKKTKGLRHSNEDEERGHIKVANEDDDSYNSAGSDDVGRVDKVNVMDTTGNKNKLPLVSDPNSVTKNNKNGKPVQERYYDENGDVYLDIDYTDHGNSKKHPIVPHQHNWVKEKGRKRRRSRITNIKKKGKK